MIDIYIKRKEYILITAIELLDENGIQGLTTKEIAKRQGISEAAIYKHFSSKREIILEILNTFSAFDQSIKNTIIEQNLKGRKALRYIANTYGEYYENYPQICTLMFSMDVYRYDEILNSTMQHMLKSKYEFVEDIIGEAQKNKVFSEEIEKSELANKFIGIIWSAVFQWKYLNRTKELKNSILKAVEEFI